MIFELPKLAYSYEALEPHIDSRTMEIHHGKHHAGYTNNLNNAIKGTSMEGLSIEEILSKLDMNNMAIRNNGGGFSKAAGTRFGSGWAWLCVHPGGKLEVCSTANQDNPLMQGIGCGGYPVLGLDVWEHAYYLNYQNRRPDYVSEFFNVINWDVVSATFNKKK